MAIKLARKEFIREMNDYLKPYVSRSEVVESIDIDNSIEFLKSYNHIKNDVHERRNGNGD